MSIIFRQRNGEYVC